MTAVLTNPAALTVIKLQCDLFSLAKIKENNASDVELFDTPILAKLKQPNAFQNQKQFLWDFMFWNMLGVSYLYADSKIINEDNPLYWLDISKVEFSDELIQKLDKLYLSKESIKALEDEIIKYHYIDGSTKKIPLKDLKTFVSLTNGNGNWYASNSVIDALYKVIGNSEKALDAKNINLDFATKFLVGGDNNSDNIYEQPLGKGEQKSIEDIVTSGKKVHALKSQINISRFVENIAQLELDDSYFADYYIIGKMFGIPREVLEANMDTGATFNNQEISRASYVEYVLEPRGQDLSEGINNFFDLQNRLSLSWSHLNFTNVVEKTKLETVKMQAETIKILIDTGVSIDDINTMLGLELDNIEQSNGE